MFEGLKLTINNNKGKLTILLVVMAAVVGYSYSKITGKDDSAVEEVAEQIIKAKTGSDVDLTPGSPETE